MAALVCGSLAFDSIATFPGRFADQIMPNQLHVLNVSFLVPTLRREFGAAPATSPTTWPGSGGSRSCSRPSAATARNTWRDCAPGARRSEHVRPGRRQPHGPGLHHHRPRQQPDHRVPSGRDAVGAPDARATDADDLKLAIIAPDGRDAMLGPRKTAERREDPVHLRSGPGTADVRRRRAARLRRSRALGRGQRLRSADALPAHRPLDRGDVALASGTASSSRSAPHGCEVWVQGQKTTVPGVVDDRGSSIPPAAAMRSGPRCSTAWSATGRSSTVPRLGNRLGALKIASRGGQNHVLDVTFVGSRNLIDLKFQIAFRSLAHGLRHDSRSRWPLRRGRRRVDPHLGGCVTGVRAQAR